jgi:flavin reductase (DIM6/NTAB) family NADH-FMN oxidoreductase RutF
MFYETEINNHGLPFNPFKSCIVPRPIGWITSLDKNGILNLAPYSYFNAVTDVPPMIIFSTTTKHHDRGVKDTLKNVEETKEFVVNIATWQLREEVNITSTDFDRGISEVKMASLQTLPSKLVKPPRIYGSPIHLECVYHQSIQLPVVDDKHTNRIVVARVIGIHIDNNIIVDGKIDVTRFQPIARLGYMEYSAVDNKFTMERPYTHETSIKI